MKRKLSIPPDRAAYAASQPLFDAFRNLCNTGESRNTRFGELRDKLQRLHVEHDKSETSDLLEDWLSGWSQTHKLQEQVLAEFSSVMGAYPMTQEQAGEYKKVFEKLHTWSKHFGEALDTSVMQVHHTMWRGVADTRPQDIIDAYREPKRRRTSTHANGAAEVADDKSNDRSKEGVQGYRDATAEVEARLKAKVNAAREAEEGAKRKWKEKKRKRESVESLASVQRQTASLGIDEQPGPSNHSRTSTGEPSRKKSRQDAREQDENRELTLPQKRKEDEHAKANADAPPVEAKRAKQTRPKMYDRTPHWSPGYDPFKARSISEDRQRPEAGNGSGAAGGGVANGGHQDEDSGHARKKRKR